MDAVPPIKTESPEGDIAVGDVLSPLKIVDLTVDGGAIARHNGQVVFLDSGVMDAVVTAKVISRSKKIIHAVVTDVLEPSPHEIVPWCPDFGRCGGCMWQHVSLPAQYAWKEKRVGDTLSRLGGFSIPVASLVTGDEKNFRTRMTYAFGEYEGRGVVGLRQKNSQQVVPLATCGLQPGAARILQATQQFLDNCPEMPVWQNKEGYWRFLTVHTPVAVLPEMSDKQVVVEIIVNKAPKETHSKVYAFLESLLEQDIISGAFVSQRTARSSLAFGEKILFEAGQTELFEYYPGMSDDSNELARPLGSTGEWDNPAATREQDSQNLRAAQPFVFSPMAFMQTNTIIFSKLLERVFALVPAMAYDNIWDLYAGCGLIGQYLVERNGSKESSRLFGVDSDASSIRYAEKNAQVRNIPKATYAAGKIETVLKRAPFSPDLIILDPPRAGVDGKVLNLINQSGASHIVYISCDVATQARDMKRLGDVWLCEKAYPFDMFPGTPHIENVVLLTRKAKGD